MDAVQRQARLRQPGLQVGDGGLVVIVEVAACREHLDGLEPVRRDFEQVLACEPAAVIQVRRYPELPFRHNGNHSF